MNRYSVLDRIAAGFLIFTVTTMLMAAEGMAAVVSLLQFSTITGESSAEMVSRETRQRVESRIGNSVDTGTGAFVLDRQVVSAGGGRSLDFNLAYNSLLTRNRGPLGFGWSHNYEARLEGDPEGTVTIHWNQNFKNSFAFVQQGEPYDPLDEAVTYDRLIRQNNGTWRLTQQDGTRFEFSANGELVRVANKVLQYLELERTGGLLTSIREPIADKEVFLSYVGDGSGLLESIEAPQGIFFFLYDPDQRLSQVFDPTEFGQMWGESIVPKNIPDNDPAGLTHTIVVSDTDPIGLVEISLGNISHASPEDLTVSLTSPEGTTAILWDGEPGGPSLSFDGRILDTFQGENPEGRWNVAMVDSEAGSSGTLNGWRIQFTEATNGYGYQYDSSNLAIDDPGPQASPAPSNLTGFRGMNGERINFEVTGDSGGSIWGTGVYTDDSRLSKAAVHAGVLNEFETGIVTVTILPGQSSYSASTQNGVSSNSFGSWTGSYALSRYQPQVTAQQASRLVRGTGPDGEQLFANTYDGEGRVSSQDDGIFTNQLASFQYEDLPSGGVRTRYSNRLGNETVFEHDDQYRLISTSDPLSNTSTWGYNNNGDRIRATDALGRSMVFNYDSRGNLITVVDPAGFVSTFEHASTGDNSNVTTIRDALGKETRFTYDSKNNLTRITDALGNQDNKTYNGNSQMTGNLLAGRGGTDISYNSGMPTGFGHPAENGNAQTEYDDAGRVTKITDIDGFTTTMQYSRTGQVLEQTDHLGNTVFSEYDRRDRLVKKIDPRGNETHFSYDNNDNLIALTDALGRTNSHEYDGEDQLIKSTDPAGRVSRLAYDAAGRLVQETDTLGKSRTHVYDAVGNVVATYDAKGIKVKEVEYEARNLPLTSRDALGHQTRAEYDAVGRLTEGEDPLSRSTVYEYDELDRPVRVRDPLNRTLSKEYWADDFVRYLTNGAGARTQFRYDNARRLDRITTPLGHNTTLDYNRRDLLVEVRKPSGRVLSYSYDALGRLTQFSSSGSGVAVPQIHYEYDANGNLTTVSSGGSATPRLRRTYDALNRLTSYTDGEGNRIDYIYDVAGNLAELVYPDGRRVTYGYDMADRLETVTDWAGRVTRYRYDANGQLVRAEFPNGTVRKIQYDPNGQVTSRQDLDGNGALIVGYRYSYDPAGQVQAEVVEHLAPSFDPADISMTYDADNRLQTFNSQSVSFDNDGNMTRGPLGSTFAFQDFSYDRRGNLVSAGGVNHSYDEEDRLVSFSDSQGTTGLVVSPSGNLSQVIQKTAPSGSTTQYVYGIGLVYEVTGSQIKVYHYDHRGSTAAFSGDSGLVVGRVDYGPFGEVIQRTGEAEALFLFSGLFGVLTEPTNGLYYMRYRWYSPQIKRFVNADAHYGDIALPHTLNRFAYTGNNPINRIDPGGEFLNLIGAAVGGAVVNVVIKVAADAISGRKIDFTDEDYWAEIGGAAASGAVTGACIGSGAGILASGVCGGLGSSAGYLVTQGLKGDKVDTTQLAIEFGVGFATGAVTAAAGRYIRFSPKSRGGQRYGQFRQGYRADSSSSFKLGLLARDSAIMNSDDYLIAQLLPRFTVRKLVGTAAGRQVAKALARRAVPAVLGAAAVAVGARVAGNTLYNPESGGDAPGSAVDNATIERDGQMAVSGGGKGKYGEYIHWQLYITSLVLAGRPVPNNPNNILATF